MAVLTVVVSVPIFDVPVTAGSHAVDALMLRLMSTYGVPGAALALVKDGRIVLESGYGFRDLATHAPVTVRTLFNIGSISKSFTALDIAQLVDQHKVDLDIPVLRYLPELRFSDPRATQTVTLRQLLSHTSGFPPDQEWPGHVPPSRQGIVQEFATIPMTAQPGTRFQYCSRCVVLAAYLLERITGQSWETYTRTQIFAPLGMTTGSFGPLGLQRAPDRAQPYHNEVVFGQFPVPWARLQFLESLDPAGGLDASVADMARYALFQLGDGTMFGQRVVSARMLAELHRSVIDVGSGFSAPVQRLHYALGWFTAEYRGVHFIYHNGANPGFRAAIALVPSAKVAVVALTNGESGRFTDAATLSLIDELR